jgi:aerobic carbon-monoxide dehydrogenase large subunit
LLERLSHIKEEGWRYGGRARYVRGAGEGGTTGALGAVVNAVVDALAEFGVTHIEMPVTPERVWRAIESAKA